MTRSTFVYISMLTMLTASSALAQEAAGQQDTTASTTAADSMLIDPNASQVPMVPEDQLYSGWRAKTLIDQEVYGPNGNDLGEIHDMIVGPDGKVSAIVVEGGGFLEIGDAMFRISWDQVKARTGGDGVMVPLTEETAENFGLYDSGDFVREGPQEFRLSELLGDRVVLNNGISYGYVNDVVIGQDGKLLSVIVNNAAAPYGAYAYPWYGYNYGWNPGLAYYALPVTEVNPAAGVVKVDPGRFGQVPFAAAQ